MDVRHKIEECVLSEFSFLPSEYGFSSPIKRGSTWHTTLVYLTIDLALEVELDWWDRDVFVLLVRLENGNLPSGYYVENGKRCRLHLEDVLESSGAATDEGLADLRKGSYPLTVDGFIKEIKMYADIVRKKLPLIMKEAKRRFDT